ncbi:hypothetical protein F3157_07960 [Virgibacillus dakarensis]|uniref:Uncharacterized protein n=1 Tax=Lentibacillus populi TaxID=1827502 RepID=A0A9W5TWW1_9BACI|nr:hypothetical protein [Lentibacillus populi]MTW85597.1 hypothetical protein [Virgibacillus dakarensis]GGB41418.1 hypothetical protein GCM10011409_18680 [Lentibacillus populi]
MKIPNYMIEKLERNLELYEELDRLRKKLHQHKTLDERASIKTKEDKLEVVLWDGFYAHEKELIESIERKKEFLNKKTHRANDEQKSI